jgi:transposase
MVERPLGFVRKVNQGVPAVLHYETKPGVQAHVDWGEFCLKTSNHHQLV